MGADGKRAFGGILIRAIEPLAGAAASENEDDDDEEEEKKGAKKGKGKAKPKAAAKKGKAAASGSVEFIEGPSLVVDRVLSVCGADSIVKFVASNFPEHADSPPAHYVAGRQLYLAPISAVASSPSVKYGMRRPHHSWPLTLTTRTPHYTRTRNRNGHHAEPRGSRIAACWSHPEEGEGRRRDLHHEGLPLLHLPRAHEER